MWNKKWRRLAVSDFPLSHWERGEGRGCEAYGSCISYSFVVFSQDNMRQKGGSAIRPSPQPSPKGRGSYSTGFMNIDSLRTISVRAIAFAGTAVFSLAMMNSLPLVKQQRQRSFAQATMDGNLSR